MAHTPATTASARTAVPMAHPTAWSRSQPDQVFVDSPKSRRTRSECQDAGSPTSSRTSELVTTASAATSGRGPRHGSRRDSRQTSQAAATVASRET